MPLSSHVVDEIQVKIVKIQQNQALQPLSHKIQFCMTDRLIYKMKILPPSPPGILGHVIGNKNIIKVGLI